MKRIIENVIIIGFVLFVIGGLLMVAVQVVGLLTLNEGLTVGADSNFAWIFPVSAVTGLLCWLYSYLGKH